MRIMWTVFAAQVNIMTESCKHYDGEEISKEQGVTDVTRYQKMLLTDDRNFVSFAEYEKKSR